LVSNCFSRQLYEQIWKFSDVQKNVLFNLH
jgi:hypothetical protein